MDLDDYLPTTQYLDPSDDERVSDYFVYDFLPAVEEAVKKELPERARGVNWVVFCEHDNEWMFHYRGREFYATPYHRGHAVLPVEIIDDDEGDVVFAKTIEPFHLTGSLENDVPHLMKTIDQVLDEYEERNGPR